MDLPLELQSLVDIYDQPFLLVDKGCRVVAINRAFEETYGVSGRDAVARPCHAILDKPRTPFPCAGDREKCPFVEVFQHERTKTVVHDYRDPDGRQHRVSVHAYPLGADSGQALLGELIQRDAERMHPQPALGSGAGESMVGNTPVFRETLKGLERAGGTEAPVLLRGETGTGKELAAAYVHRHSARSRGPFITLDCTALSGELFESEVFGHARGAFTGSSGEKKGLYELADGGTLFLDEIGEMPLPLQSKLLRVLESGTFRRVGGTRTRRANVRVICATNRELRGVPWFRSDLYYRVACLTVNLPSLVDRRADIPLLAAELLRRIGQTSGRWYSIDAAGIDRLMGYDFPGNIRELRNILWVAAVNAPEGRISAAQIAAALPESPSGGEAASTGTNVAAEPERAPAHIGRRARHAWEADHLAQALRRHNGNRRAAARELGVSERTVYRKLRQLGLR